LALPESDVSGPWDVFVSYARTDLGDVRPIIDALKAQEVNGRRLSVFIDEESIEFHKSITREISLALANSAVMLVYYSRTYPTRTACQKELTAAFLAAQRSGDVADRILVINPEQNEDHIEPVELRAIRYRPKPATKQQRRRLAQDIADLVAASPGPLRASVIAPGAIRWWPPEWPQIPRDIVGRYADLWRLHSALHSGRFPFVAQAAPVSVAVVSGLSGIGKTTIAERYAVEFGAAFPGGVARLSLAGDGDASLPAGAVLAGYQRELRKLAKWADVPAARAPGEQLRLILADHFTQRSEPLLWIIDDVPAGLPAETVRALVVPSPYVCTIITTSDSRYAGLGVPLPLAGLSPAESLELLAGCYDPREEAEVLGLAEDLGGHPLALRMAGSMLRERRGLISVAEHRPRIGATVSDVVSGILADADETTRTVLGLAAVLAPAAIPPKLLAGALAARWGCALEEVRDRLVTALTRLEQQCVLTRHDESISIHPVVLRAVPDNEAGTLRAAAAAALAELLPDGVTDVLETHVRHLAQADDLADDAAIPLYSWLATADERSGDYLSAGQAGEQLTARLGRRYGPSDARVLAAGIAAARAFVTVGDYDSAISLAQMAAAAAAGREERGASARHVLARALDGLGRFSDADAYWTAVAGALPAMERDTASAWRIDQARALRLRGRLTEAADVLEAAAEGPPERYVEEAALYQLAGRPVLAQRAADRAVAAFREIGWEHHPACLEAIGLGIDARLTIISRKPGWRMPRKPLKELDELGCDYSRRYGPDSPLTLAARIHYGIESAAWMNTGDRKRLEDAEQAARTRLGADHPLRLRALYGLSMAAAICDKDLRAAHDLARQAYDGQRRVLGERHPDTLTSMLQLGVTRYCMDGDEAATETVDRASRELREVLGPLHFEVLRGRVAQVTMLLPAPVLRGLTFSGLTVLQGAERVSQQLGRLLGRESQREQ
jgi:tetratricopeptide (TPR) repeat protein